MLIVLPSLKGLTSISSHKLYEITLPPPKYERGKDRHYTYSCVCVKCNCVNKLRSVKMYARYLLYHRVCMVASMFPLYKIYMFTKDRTDRKF